MTSYSDNDFSNVYLDFHGNSDGLDKAYEYYKLLTLTFDQLPRRAEIDRMQHFIIALDELHEEYYTMQDFSDMYGNGYE